MTTPRTGVGTEGLRAEGSVAAGSFTARLSLEVAPGEVVALLGPNGAGKSTALRALAGLVALDDGRIELDGQVFDEPATDTWVPPEGRRVGMVFQDHALFDHLDAAANVAFGLRAAGVGRRQARAEAASWLERVGLAELADRRPGRLSGGQRQRVALARALAARPRLVLLDEPTAALDGPTRAELRAQLRRHLVEVALPAVVVSHDPVDAQVLADRVVVVERGRVVQSGRLADLAAHPRSPYVADLVGVNLLEGTLVGPGVVRTADGGLLHGTPAGGSDDQLEEREAHDEIDRTGAGGPFGAPVRASLHPRAVALYREEPHGSPRNAWRATIADVDRRGDQVRVRLHGPPAVTAEITAAALTALDLRPGAEVWAVVKASEVRLSAAPDRA